MEDKGKKGKQPYTTIWLPKAVRDRMRTAKGKGMSWERFFNQVMDVAFPQEEDKE